MNVDTDAKRRHLDYEITSDKNCPTQLSEHAHMKLLAANNDADGSYCILLWTCRKSREGVHAFCTDSKVSDRQKRWIRNQYRQLSLTKVEVEHNKDYKNGKCFRKKPF